MEFKFSTVLDNTNCYIRAYERRSVVEKKRVDRPHKHYFMEFHWICSGEQTVVFQDLQRQVVLRPGQILLVPQETYHNVVAAEGTVERICFNFSVEALEKGKSPIVELYKSVTEPMVFVDKVAAGFLEQCWALLLEPDAPLLENRQGVLLLSAVLQLFGRLPKAKAIAAGAATNAQRQRWIIEEYVEGYFNLPNGMAGLAKALHLSEKQSRKLVRKFLGEDFKSVIVRRRMELAMIYLANPEKSLEEIAWQVGYRSYSGFQLCFKRYFGVSPSEKRRELLENREEQLC